MTEEELKQKAIENVCKRNPFVEKEWFIDAFKKYDKGERINYLKEYEIDEYESYIAGATEATKELEKENAELKEKLKPENCLKLLTKDGYIKFTNEQLTKAREIISEWEDSFCCGANYLYLGDKGKELRIKSQKFLNNEVEK